MNKIQSIPIKNIGDPYVLNHEGKYYLYATSGFDGFYCWESADLHTWGAPQICYEPGDRSFGGSCFWAPEVYHFDGRFFMYYTAQWKIYEEEELRIGVAVADAPTGPFADVFVEAPMFDPGYGCLDAHVLEDEGKKYFYFSRAGAGHYVNGNKQAEIYVAQMNDDNISLKNSAKLLLVPEQEWELAQPEKKQFWNEGPFVLRHEGKYYLMYSANFYASEYYGIGVAEAEKPLGPFKKYLDNPILSTNAFVSGPGHNSVVRGNDGKLYCVFHAHTDREKKGEDRQVYITTLHFENGKLCADCS